MAAPIKRLLVDSELHSRLSEQAERVARTMWSLGPSCCRRSCPSGALALFSVWTGCRPVSSRDACGHASICCMVPKAGRKLSKHKAGGGRVLVGSRDGAQSLS